VSTSSALEIASRREQERLASSGARAYPRPGSEIRPRAMALQEGSGPIQVAERHEGFDVIGVEAILDVIAHAHLVEDAHRLRAEHVDASGFAVGEGDERTGSQGAGDEQSVADRFGEGYGAVGIRARCIDGAGKNSRICTVPEALHEIAGLTRTFRDIDGFIRVRERECTVSRPGLELRQVPEELGDRALVSLRPDALEVELESASGCGDVVHRLRPVRG
jgi:hypothetical protein